MITKEHIDALVALLARDDKETLTDCLVNSVRRLARHAEVQVFELTDASGAADAIARVTEGWRFRPAGRLDDPGRLLREQPDFCDAIATQRVVRTSPDNGAGIRLVFPVRGQQGISGLLVIDCATADADTMFVIEALSHAWNNQQYLLDRTERDRLTGLLNRHAFDRRLQAIFGPVLIAARAGEPFAPRCLGLVDIDHFKQVNDRHGHLLGDEVLVQIARLLRGAFRGYDQLFRYGGEEFLVVLQHASLEQARSAFERLRQMVAQHRFPQLGQITVSAGVVQIQGGELPTTTLERADKALYHAKKTGRNRTVLYEDLVASGTLPVRPRPSGDVELF